MLTEDGSSRLLRVAAKDCDALLVDDMASTCMVILAGNGKEPSSSPSDRKSWYVDIGTRYLEIGLVPNWVSSCLDRNELFPA
jgi:hypothetical protein